MRIPTPTRRTPTHGRGTPGTLRTPTIDSRPRRRIVPILAALLAAGALIAGGTYLARALGTPNDIADTHLDGARSPLPYQFIVLLDWSGSFDDYDAIRRDALEQLTTWMPANLHDDDMITVLGFTTQAVTMLPPTRADEMAADPPMIRAPVFDDYGTKIGPALRLAASYATPERQQSLIVVTDTELGDIDPSAAKDAVRRIHADSMTLILPAGHGVDSPWAESFPWENVIHVDNGDADATAMAIAEAVAYATRQTLAKK